MGVEKEAIEVMVCSGLGDRYDMERRIDDYYRTRPEIGEEYNVPTLKAYAMATVDEELEKKAIDEATWESPTDCDRLDAAIDELENRGIDWWILDWYKEPEGVYTGHGWVRQKEKLGFCYIHTNDIGNATYQPSVLTLAFGGCTDDGEYRHGRKYAAKAGKVIKQVLSEHGFTVQGSVSSGRLYLPNFRWRKRQPVLPPPIKIQVPARDMSDPNVAGPIEAAIDTLAKSGARVFPEYGYDRRMGLGAPVPGAGASTP